MSQPQRIEPVESSSATAPDPAIDATITVLDLVFGAPFERAYDIRLWDETARHGTANPRADFSLHIRRRGALRRNAAARHRSCRFVEAFISNDIDIDGNVESAMGLADAIGKRIQSFGGIARLIPKVLALPRDDDSPPLDETRYARSLRLLTPGARKSTEPEIQFHYGRRQRLLRALAGSEHDLHLRIL